MKKILLFIALVCSTTITFAQAPCVPGTQSTPANSYILPDSATNLDHGCAGMPYEQIIYMKVPADTTLTVLSIPITADVDSFVIDANVVGLPMGLTVTSVPGLLPPNASNPKTNFTRLVIPGDSIACVKLSGTLPAGLSPGDINLTINMRAYLSGVPFPLGPTIDTPAIIDYYKITIDAPGTGACNPASTKDLIKNNITNIKLSPNPVHDEIMVDLELNETSNYALSVVDVMGRTLLTNEKRFERGLNSIPISLGHLPNGIYFLKISSESSSLTKKIVVQH